MDIRLTARAATAVLALLLVACGGSAETGEASQPAPVTESAQSDPAPTNPPAPDAGPTPGAIPPTPTEAGPSATAPSASAPSASAPASLPATGAASPPSVQPQPTAAPSTPIDPQPAPAPPPAEPAPDRAPAEQAPEGSPADAPVALGIRPGTYVSDVEVSSSAGDSSGILEQRWEPVATDGRQAGRTEGDSGSSGPGGGAMSQVVLHQPDAILLVEQIAEEDDSGDLSFRPPEPLLLSPIGGQVGTTWSWTMTSISGETTVDLQAKLLRREPFEIDGSTVEAMVVSSTLTITNPDFRATQQRTTWLDEAGRLTLREESATEGQAAIGVVPVEFTASTTQQLRSRTPR